MDRRAGLRLALFFYLGCMDYISTNQKLWDSRVPHHYTSDFYDVPGFLNGVNTLTEIELPLLGDVRDKKVLHLQCHFGLDTLSLARMGAKATGLDFSSAAIEKARQLSRDAQLNVEFIEANVYDADTLIDGKADIVFASFGVVGWLPDLNRWARVVANCLKPDGEFVFAEFHPVICMFDNDLVRPTYSYFQRDAIVETEQGTYADTGAPLSLESVGWNHSLGEVFNALKGAGLQVTHFEEYDFAPFPALNNSVAVGERRWQIKGLEGILPMVYSLKAVKAG
jgi:SAM-dependent methyltransferase